MAFASDVVAGGVVPGELGVVGEGAVRARGSEIERIKSVQGNGDQEIAGSVGCGRDAGAVKSDRDRREVRFARILRPIAVEIVEEMAVGHCQRGHGIKDADRPRVAALYGLRVSVRTVAVAPRNETIDWQIT